MKTSERSNILKKRLVGATVCLMAAAAVLASVPVKTDAASVSWTNRSISVSSDNATVRIRANAPKKVKWTAASGTIFDASGNVVAKKTEKASANNKYMNIWYDVKGEMKKSLKPSTTYKVQFTATYGGTTYKSGKYSFTTAKKAQKGTMNSFLSDSRWKNGTSWGENQRPKLSPYSSKGCCAYVSDYAKYVHLKNSPTAGTAYYKTSQIKAGDIVRVSGHWLVVVSRNGNTLKTAEGNVNMDKTRKVHVSNGKWTIKGNSLKNKYEKNARVLIAGYHFQ